MAPKIEAARALLGPAFQVTEASRKAASARAAAREALMPEEDEDEKGFFGGFTGIFKGKDARYKGVSAAKLAALHKSLKTSSVVVQKAVFRWESAVLRAIELEYTVAGLVPPIPVKKSTVDGKAYYVAPKAPPPEKGAPPASPLLSLATGLPPPPGINADAFDVLSESAGLHIHRILCCPTLLDGALNTASWRFKHSFKPATFKALSVVAEVLSILLLWSEATIWLNLTGLVQQNLSVFGLLLIYFDNSSQVEYFAILVASAVPLAYMCLLSMYTVFKLKVFGMLDLAGYQNSDSYSLLVNVRTELASPRTLSQQRN
jgi:hypothetical protein